VEFHKIALKANNGDLTVITREGYYSDRDLDRINDASPVVGRTRMTPHTKSPRRYANHIQGFFHKGLNRSMCPGSKWLFVLMSFLLRRIAQLSAVLPPPGCAGAALVFECEALYVFAAGALPVFECEALYVLAAGAFPVFECEAL